MLAGVPVAVIESLFQDVRGLLRRASGSVATGHARLYGVTKVVLFKVRFSGWWLALLLVWPLSGVGPAGVGPAAVAQEPPKLTTPEQARELARSSRARVLSAEKCIRSAVERQVVADDRVAREQKRVAELEAEKERVLRELRSGKFCSKCLNTASQIEKGGESFTKHLGRVKGDPVPASPEKIAAKTREYDAKIAAARQALESAMAASQKARDGQVKCAQDRSEAAALVSYAEVMERRLELLRKKLAAERVRKLAALKLARERARVERERARVERQRLAGLEREKRAQEQRLRELREKQRKAFEVVTVNRPLGMPQGPDPRLVDFNKPSGGPAEPGGGAPEPVVATPPVPPQVPTDPVEPKKEEGPCGVRGAAPGVARLSWTISGSMPNLVCPPLSYLRIRSTNRPPACTIDTTVPCRDGKVSLTWLAPVSYSLETTLTPWQSQPQPQLSLAVVASGATEYSFDHRAQFCPRLVRVLARLDPEVRAKFPERFTLQMRFRYQKDDGGLLWRASSSLTFSDGMTSVGWMELFPGRGAPNEGHYHLLRQVILEAAQLTTDLAATPDSQWVSAQAVQPVSPPSGTIHWLPSLAVLSPGQVCPTHSAGTFPATYPISHTATVSFAPTQMGKPGVTPVSIQIQLQSK